MMYSLSVSSSFAVLQLLFRFRFLLLFPVPSCSMTAAVVSVSPAARALYRRTPLVHSASLSQRVQRDVYLKLDNLQASGSFKDRGMAHLCTELSQQQGGNAISRVISSSGGNAGLAVATVAPQLGLEVQVIVPETTKPLVVQKLQALGAHVTIHGANWNAADQLARQWVDEAAGAAAYISPYDNPLLWTGHATVVDEILDDLPNTAAICLSVGGGGLLLGVLEGLMTNRQQQSSSSLSPVRVVAAETTGAACFHAALQAGHTVRLPAITSIATSLGALETTPVALQRTAEYCNGDPSLVQSLTCTDAQAVQACLHLAADHRMLVEPACGAALAAVYDSQLYAQHLDNKDGPIVVQVCGGSGVSIDLLQQWKRELQLK